MLKTTLFLCPSQLKNRSSSIYSKAKLNLLNNFKWLRHSSTCSSKKKMEVHILPVLKDNFTYIIVDKESNEAAVVDPVEPESVYCFTKKHKYNLTKILTTHHHWDHAGGNEKLAQISDQLLAVYGGDSRIPALTDNVSHGTNIQMGCLNIQCLHTPCHTTGHISYYVTISGADPVVFTGDTLFIGGCGKFFEGDAQQMHVSLNGVLGNLPKETKVYCGHEYTVSNLVFANHVEPKNKDIQDKMRWAVRQRNQGFNTIPSTIGEEKKINPFMRVCEEDVQRHTGKSIPVEVMAFLRKEKDGFKANN